MREMRMLVHEAFGMEHDWKVMSEQQLLATSGLSLERLDTFLRIVDAGGITAAAGTDPNRQSQFSRQLKQLEVFFGTQLARRGRGQLVLTSAGTELHRLAQLHFAALDDLRRECARQPLELRLGAGESLLQWHVLSRLKQIAQCLPDCTWTLENCQSRELAVRLGDGRLDFAIMRADAVTSSIGAVELGLYGVVAIIPAEKSTEPIPRNPKALLSRIACYPLALLEGSTPAIALEEAARQHGIRLKVAARCTSYLQCLEAIRALACATLLPEFAIPHVTLSKIIAVPLPTNWGGVRRIVLAWNPRTIGVRSALERSRNVLENTLRLVPATKLRTVRVKHASGIRGK